MSKNLIHALNLYRNQVQPKPKKEPKPELESTEESTDEQENS